MAQPRARRPHAAARFPPEHHHREVQAGGPRAAVFGVSDGLVSNLSLILGLAGASPATSVIRLAGLAGLLGGAFSMAAGEYVSMRAQNELVEKEVEKERREIERHPKGEHHELVRLYESRGIPLTLASQLADRVMADPELALETHAREELGIDLASPGRPLQAAGWSFVTFAVGAAIPLVPYSAGAGTAALVGAICAAALAALIVGGLLSIFTSRPWWWSAARQLLICAVAGAVTFAIGRAIGVSGVGSSG
jgi:VIT1/CCC1 family predicted Fe2+/Mn2+ transporter